MILIPHVETRDQIAGVHEQTFRSRFHAIVSALRSNGHEIDPSIVPIRLVRMEHKISGQPAPGVLQSGPIRLVRMVNKIPSATTSP
jgi:hypothetical protein